jgi:integrase/recombinase XerD
MLEKYFVKPQTIDRIRAHWLGEPIERYITWLNERGYGHRTVFRRVPLLLRFGTYAESKGATQWADLPKHVRPFVEDWCRKHGLNRRPDPGRKSVANEIRGPVEQMISVVLPQFSVTGRRRLFPFCDQVPGFRAHLRDERGLRPPTVQGYRQFLGHLERYLKEIKVHSLRELSPAILSAFVTKKSAGWGMSMIGGLCGVLRVFLRYLFREELISQDLAQTIEGPKEYRLSSIPRSIPWSDVGRMLSAVDRRTSLGKRDYAILLLLVTYGLRGREIAALTLDDIDWEHGRLRVPERKAGHSTAYPLSPIVGEAVLDYLKHGRPQTTGRQVFYRAMAPFGPMTYTAVSVRASYYLHKIGATVPRPGSHTLRHTCVQRLLDAQFSLKTIGDYVGHGSPDSTAIYAKVSIEKLRQVALGDGEEVV